MPTPEASQKDSHRSLQCRAHRLGGQLCMMSLAPTHQMNRAEIPVMDRTVPYRAHHRHSPMRIPPHGQREETTACHIIFTRIVPPPSQTHRFTAQTQVPTATAVPAALSIPRSQTNPYLHLQLGRRTSSHHARQSLYPAVEAKKSPIHGPPNKKGLKQISLLQSQPRSMHHQNQTPPN